MARLIMDDVEVASVEVAHRYAERARGLLGRDGIETGLVLRPGSSVHTLGMRFAIDVVFVRGAGGGVAVVPLVPPRRRRPRPRSAWILETEAGRAREWGISPGKVLELS